MKSKKQIRYTFVQDQDCHWLLPHHLLDDFLDKFEQYRSDAPSKYSFIDPKER